MQWDLPKHGTEVKLAHPVHAGQLLLHHFTYSGHLPDHRYGRFIQLTGVNTQAPCAVWLHRQHDWATPLTVDLRYDTYVDELAQQPP